MSAAAAASSSKFAHAAGRVQHWMKHHPMVSNSVLCLNLWIAGDFVAQYSEFRYLNKDDDMTSSKTKDDELVSKKNAASRSFWEELDVWRTAKCAGYGATITGPLLATWYPFLDRVCVRYNVTRRFGLWGAPILKVLADELLMDPPCLALFYGYMNVWEGGSLATFQSKLETQFVPSWLTSLAIWPWILLGTFRFVPLYAQAPLINACGILWDGFLSHRNNLSKTQHKVPVVVVQQKQTTSPVEKGTNDDDDDEQRRS